MNFAHYRWNAEEIPADNFYFGEPSRRIFDPHNGNQVLFLMNCYASAMPHVSLSEVRRFESIMAHQLPPNLKSEISVFNWMLKAMTHGGKQSGDTA